MDLEVIKDLHDPEDLIFSFTCKVCRDGYAVGWEELPGDLIYIEKGALKQLNNHNET